MSSKYTHLFKPIKIRGVDFKNRFILAPPSCHLVGADGLITTRYVEWFRTIARGGASILYNGNCTIDYTESKDENYIIDLSHPDAELPLSWYAEMCKEYDCHASLEVNHCGKDALFETFGRLPYSSSPIPGETEIRHAAQQNREVRIPIEMDQAKIDETVLKYAQACLKMKRAGMDIALLHGGHGNLISQFTSPHYNKRTDKYGGSTEKRARFAIEIVEKVRELCGENFVIDYRISGDEIIDDGMHIDETIKLMKILTDHGVDMFNISAGLHTEGAQLYAKYWLQSYSMPHGFNVHWSQKIKDKLQGDVIISAVGSITNVDIAEEYLAKGYCDFIAMCRPLMADPDMPKKAAQNRPEDIRPCLRCNECIMRLSVPGANKPTGPKEVNCAVNPLLGLPMIIKESDLPLARKKKKVAVIGGGVAGLTALFTGVERGHEVTLYEKSGRVGGQIIPAAVPSFKMDMKDYLKWLEVQTQKIIDAGSAKVLLNTEAAPALIEKEGYDAVIIAVGAEPIIPDVPGIAKPHVMWAADAQTVLRSKVGGKVVIVGAGDVGMEAAADFFDEGKEVEVIDMIKSPSYPSYDPESGLIRGFNAFPGELEKRGVAIRYETSLVEVTDSGVIVKGTDGQPYEIKADSVLLAVGMKSNTALAESFRHCAPETECIVVGDAKDIGGNITRAVNPAFQAVYNL